MAAAAPERRESRRPYALGVGDDERERAEDLRTLAEDCRLDLYRDRCC